MTTAELDLRARLTVDELIARAALRRQESRGGHFRRDFPKRDDQNFLKHTLIFKQPDGQYKAEYKDVVITKFPPNAPKPQAK